MEYAEECKNWKGIKVKQPVYAGYQICKAVDSNPKSLNLIGIELLIQSINKLWQTDQSNKR